MANPLFSMLGGNQSPVGNVMNLMNQLKQNPLALLGKAGYNIPANMNDPRQIIQHLTQSGQINQAQLNQAQQLAQMFK